MRCGVVLLDVVRLWNYGISSSHGHGSAFLAELLYVDLGLIYAWDHVYRVIECNLDCDGMV